MPLAHPEDHGCLSGCHHDPAHVNTEACDAPARTKRNMVGQNTHHDGYGDPRSRHPEPKPCTPRLRPALNSDKSRITHLGATYERGNVHMRRAVAESRRVGVRGVS